MTYLYLKALHIIFVVTWFAGMFYIVRLFVYNREAQDKSEPERGILTKQLNIMIKRLYLAITLPSAILTLVFGLWVLLSVPYFFDTIWMKIKLAFVVLLYFYQYSLHIIYKQQAVGVFKHTSNQLRLWNEVPTIILIGVVFLVVVKTGLSLVYGLLGMIALMVVLMAAIKIYKKMREKKVDN